MHFHTAVHSGKACAVGLAFVAYNLGKAYLGGCAVAYGFVANANAVFYAEFVFMGSLASVVCVYIQLEGRIRRINFRHTVKIISAGIYFILIIEIFLACGYVLPSTGGGAYVNAFVAVVPDFFVGNAVDNDGGSAFIGIINVSGVVGSTVPLGKVHFINRFGVGNIAVIQQGPAKTACTAIAQNLYRGCIREGFVLFIGCGLGLYADKVERDFKFQHAHFGAGCINGIFHTAAYKAVAVGNGTHFYLYTVACKVCGGIGIISIGTVLARIGIYARFLAKAYRRSNRVSYFVAYIPFVNIRYRNTAVIGIYNVAYKKV